MFEYAVTISEMETFTFYCEGDPSEFIPNAIDITTIRKLK